MSRFEQKSGGAISSMDLKRPSVKLMYWLMFSVLMVLVCVCLLPPLWIFISSMKSTEELYQIPPTLFPKEFDLGKIAEVWKSLKFMRYYLNTTIVAGGAVVFSIIVNGLAGYVISRLRPKGSKLYLNIMLWTMLLPNTLSLVPLFKTMIDFPVFGFNLTNTYWPMWLMCGCNAFYVLIFKGFFDGVPMALVEAAKLDGSGNLGIFFRIMIPLSMPIIGVATIFTVIGVWGDFLLPYLMLTDKDAQTIMVRIFNIKNTSLYTLDVQLMSLVLSILPSVVIFLFFQRYIMQGFTLSGIKG